MIPWIQVYSNLPQHPKTFKLAEELKITSSFVSANVEAVGVLVSLWTWAVQNAYDGDLSGCSVATIADACRWKKKPETLVNALIASGYLDEDMRLHDWEEYANLLMDAEDNRRENTRARVQKYREKKRACNADVTVTQALQVTQNDVTSNADVTQCNAPTIPYHTIPNITEPNNNSIYLSEKERKERALKDAMTAKRLFDKGFISEANNFADAAEEGGIVLDRKTMTVAV